MSSNRKRLTDAERTQRRRRDRERLEQATRGLLTSDGWRQWLRVRATLHGYSLRNTWLLAHQAGARGISLTHVAGFRAWLKLNRCVRRGERGLAILAPMTVKERDERGQDTGETRTFFRAAHVFDVSQTDPLPSTEPIPLEPPREPLRGDSHTHLLPPLEAAAAGLGYVVRYESLGGPEGLCDRRRRLLRVEEGLAANARVCALVHEFAHMLIPPEARLGKAVEEVVVESVAFVVCAGAGLDTSSDSVGYIASWGKEDTLAAVQEASELIDRLASQIELAFHDQNGSEEAA